MMMMMMTSMRVLILFLNELPRVNQQTGKTERKEERYQVPPEPVEPTKVSIGHIIIISLIRKKEHSRWGEKKVDSSHQTGRIAPRLERQQQQQHSRLNRAINLMLYPCVCVCACLPVEALSLQCTHQFTTADSLRSREKREIKRIEHLLVVFLFGSQTTTACLSVWLSVSKRVRVCVSCALCGVYVPLCNYRFQQPHRQPTTSSDTASWQQQRQPTNRRTNQQTATTIASSISTETEQNWKKKSKFR